MADEKHLEILHKGVAAWNEWREANPEVQPDLSSAILSRINLTGADLTDTSFGYAFLSGASLSSADLRGANLRGANLDNASFRNAFLHGADLQRARGLTQDRIDAAQGDDETKLPDDLTRPSSWSKG